MSLAVARTTIINKIKNDIPSFKTCTSHPGRFNLGELKRYGAKSPAALVAALNVKNIMRQADYSEGDVLWSVFIVTKDGPQLSRDVAALAYVDALGRLIPDQRWGLDPDLGNPQNVDANNLYSGDIDKHGIALWAVTWTQRVSLGAALPVSSLEDFNAYYAEHSISENEDVPTSADEITLTQ